MRNPSVRQAAQQIHSDGDSPDEISDNTQQPPAKRGHTKMKRIAELPDGKQLDVTTNSFNQFNSENTTTFANYLGTLARNGEEVPLTYKDWRHVPDDKKNRIWGLVKLKWNVQEEDKDQVLKILGKKWREFRYNLKKNHYDKHDSYDARVADRDDRVLLDQWKWLINEWDSEEFQEKSEKNKASRAEQTTPHCMGSKSFARVAEEERKRNNRSPTRAELFSVTHCDKGGTPMNPETAEVLSKMDELRKDQPELAHKDITDGDLYGEIFGKEKNGRIRGLGLGPTPSDVWGDGSTRTKSRRMVAEAREAQRKAEETTRKVQEANNQQNLAIIEELAALRAKIAELEKDKHGDARQNDVPHVGMANERKYNYNQNNTSDKDDASSAASHQVPRHNGSMRNIAKKRTYNLDPRTTQMHNELTNEDLRRTKHQKNAQKIAPNMDPRTTQTQKELIN